MATFGRSRILISYVIASGAIMAAISAVQYHKYSMFGTNLLLGWDSPRYVWLAKDAINEGPLQMIRSLDYPHLYVQLLAFLGYLTGNVAVVERVLPLIFGIILIFANAQITLRITKNIHIAGLAALLTSLSLNTLRLFADLNRNFMVLSLSFTSFLLISDLTKHHVFSRRSLLSKTYLSIVLIFLVIAGTQLETFFVLALSTILTGILSRNWKKLVALALAPTIPTAVLLALFPQILPRYLGQINLFTSELMFDEIFLWSGGSWGLFCFLIAGVVYVSYKAVRQKDMLASAIFSWVAVTTLVVILTMQRVIPLSAEYALRALQILPIPLLAALAIFASADLLKGVFFEIGVSSLTRRHAVTVNVKHMSLIGTTLVLIISSITITSQHYDEFLIPFIPKSGYDKVSAAGQFLSNNGFSKPIVVFYGEHASWYGALYSSYIGAEIGDHYTYRGDVNGLLHFSATGSQSGQQAVFACPIMLITPYLYDKEIPYYLTPYHIGQGIYVIPPRSAISSNIDYGPTVTVIGENGIKEVRSEYLYANQDDPSLIVLRVAARGHRSYTFENYPSYWTFLKLEQGGVLSFPEKDPRRLDGRSAIEGNDPSESPQDWNTLQVANISTVNTLQKEGFACLKAEGIVNSWGNLGSRYNPNGIWDLSAQSFLAVWARASEMATFSITLTDSAGNTRTFWDIQPDGSSASTKWKRFAVNLNNSTNQTPNFDLSKTDYVDFYIYSTPGKRMSLWIDDPVMDHVPMVEQAVYKARVLNKDPLIAYFVVRSG